MGRAKCTSRTLCSSWVAAIPMTEQILLSFVPFLFKEGLSEGRVKLCLAAAQHGQIGLAFGDPLIARDAQTELFHEGAQDVYPKEGEVYSPANNGNNA